MGRRVLAIHVLCYEQTSVAPESQATALTDPRPADEESEVARFCRGEAREEAVRTNVFFCFACVNTPNVGYFKNR